VNPHDEQVIGCIPAATAEDVDLAVAAAKRAFESGTWAKETYAQRATVLRRIAELCKEQKSTLAVLETLDMGKPIDESDWDMDDVAGCFEYYADRADEMMQTGKKDVDLGMDEFKGYVVKEPLGVVALITPWNYPMLMATWKVAPALAAGCSVILKPSEMASLTCLKLAELAQRAGVPPGALNVLPGLGTDAGAALAAHPSVDKVAFTGSVATGRAIMSTCAQRVRPVGLELGGKSPLIVFDDVDIPRAVEWCMFGIFWTNGQICSATSRLLVHERVAPAFLRCLKDEIAKIPILNPLEKASRLGPLVSATQYQRVLACVSAAKAEGATLLTGGGRPSTQPRGYYLQPTVFVDVQPHMAIWREEVFGPVLAVRTFRTEAQAVAEANDSDFGLAAAVITADEARAARCVQALRCGIVWVNCSQPCFASMPWGGLKRSGFGRDLGETAIDNYCNTKQVVSYVSKDHWAWYPSFQQRSKL